MGDWTKIERSSAGAGPSETAGLFIGSQKRPFCILLVSSDAPFFVTHFLPLARMAIERGADVHLATPVDPGSGRDDGVAARQIERCGVTVHRIGLRRANMNPFGELALVRELGRLSRRIAPDLVHCIGIKPILYAGAIARLTRVPAVHSVIGLGLPFMEKGVPARLRRGLILGGFAFAFGNPRSLVTVEHDQDQATIRRAVPLGRITRVYGVGADLSRFYPRLEEPAEAQRAPIVMFAARLIEAKGVRDFVSAARRLKLRKIPARFVLQCQLDLRNPQAVSEAEVKAWHDEGAIEWWGQTGDMPGALRKADIFCLPTYYREGTPKVLLEAAASGLPIVTTDIPGCRDVVDHGRNGLLITPQNVDELEAAVARLIRDPDFRSAAGKRSRQIAVERFSAGRFTDTIMALYDSFLPGQAPMAHDAVKTAKRAGLSR